MKRIYIAATILFWLGVSAIWASSHWLPVKQEAPRQAAAKTYSLQTVATHRRADNCWMAINGAVYDLSAYIPQHPSAPEVMLAWCGKEASQAFMTKNRGRAHSPYATELLQRYRIGTLEVR